MPDWGWRAMLDLHTQLREYGRQLDEITPHPVLEVVMGSGRPATLRLRPVRAFAAAFGVALAAIGVVWFVKASDPTADVTEQPAAPESALVEDAGILKCLPLDPAGWSRSEPLPVPLMNHTRLASNGHTVVAVGTGTTFVDAYRSIDGLQWDPIEGFPVIEYHGGQPPTVAGGAKGFVAIATSPFVPDRESTAVVAYSEDGTTWEHINPETLPEPKVQWLSDVIAGPDGFVILGASGSESFAWFSADGRTWIDSELPTDGFDLVAVVNTESGWAAIIGRAGRAGRWESTDGSTWTETDIHDAPPLLRFGGYLRQSPQVVLDNTWVLVNEFHEHGNATAWVSNDNGRTWDEYRIGGEDASNETAFFDLDVTSFGLLLAGRHDLGATATNLLYYSQDGGATWQHCQTAVASSGTPEITQIDTIGDTLILFDDHTGSFHTWTDPATTP